MPEPAPAPAPDDVDERRYVPPPERWPREWPVVLDPAARYDYVGRKQPRRVDFVMWARSIPGYAGLFTGRVPGEFYIQVEPDVIEISCPCGETPRCEKMIPRKKVEPTSPPPPSGPPPKPKW